MPDTPLNNDPGDELVVTHQGEPSVRRLSPLNDVMFSCLFDDITRTGQSMKEFLNALLVSEGEEPIEEIVEMKSEYTMMPEGAIQKLGRFDVKVKSISGVIYDIEVQITRDSMNERDLFYGSRIISRESPSGMKYPELPKVRMISICNFHVRTSSTEIVEPIQLVYKKGPREVATDALEIYHIQLPEFRKRYKTIASVMDDPLLRWLYFFESGYKSEEETEMLAQTSEGMREIVDRYGTAIMDPVLISRYDAIEDARREEASRLAYARREAAKEAAKETNRKNAKGFKERGFDPKAIAEVCGLTLEEVEAL